MILQVPQSSRQDIDQSLDYRIKAGDGTTVPLSIAAALTFLMALSTVGMPEATLNI